MKIFKFFFQFLKYDSSNTVVVEPTVEIDYTFLLGTITIMGISAANNLFDKNKKINR